MILPEQGRFQSKDKSWVSAAVNQKNVLSQSTQRDAAGACRMVGPWARSRLVLLSSEFNTALHIQLKADISKLWLNQKCFAATSFQILFTININTSSNFGKKNGYNWARKGNCHLRFTLTKVHDTIRPSEETEKKFKLLSMSSFCHLTFKQADNPS